MPAFLGRPADVITPNGFEDSFVPVKDAYYQEKGRGKK